MTSYSHLDQAFSDARDSLIARWLRPQGTDDRTTYLQTEAIRRLEQCRWCLARVMNLEGPENNPDGYSFSTEGPHANEIEIVTESFYYFAHRFMDLCSDVPGMRIDGVKAPSIRIVRNMLIEHADGKNGVVASVFAWGDDGGPQVKPYLGEGTRPEAPGLYQHADELITSLRFALAKDKLK